MDEYSSKSKIPGEKGYLRISNEAERIEIAKLLYKQGYTVSPVKFKKDGKNFVYLVKYEMKPREIKEVDLIDEG